MGSLNERAATSRRSASAFFDYLPDPTQPEPVWLGSLMTHKRDASGQLYMRNRYFDPTSGRSTSFHIGEAGWPLLVSPLRVSPVHSQ